MTSIFIATERAERRGEFLLKNLRVAIVLRLMYS